MKLAQHRSTGTRHIVKETVVEEDGQGNYKTECGGWAYGESEHSPMLEEFPEDFGKSDIDCQRCAETISL